MFVCHPLVANLSKSFTYPRRPSVVRVLRQKHCQYVSRVWSSDGDQTVDRFFPDRRVRVFQSDGQESRAFRLPTLPDYFNDSGT